MLFFKKYLCGRNFLSCLRSNWQIFVLLFLFSKNISIWNLSSLEAKILFAQKRKNINLPRAQILQKCAQIYKISTDLNNFIQWIDIITNKKD